MERYKLTIRREVAETHSTPDGGADRARTDDPRLARAALSQLSYSPIFRHDTLGHRDKSACSLVGLGRLELPTSRLSGVRSNRLSYRPR